MLITVMKSLGSSVSRATKSSGGIQKTSGFSIISSLDDEVSLIYQGRAFVTAILIHPLDVRCTSTLINLCKSNEVVIVDKCKIGYYQIDKCNMAY